MFVQKKLSIWPPCAAVLFLLMFCFGAKVGAQTVADQVTGSVLEVESGPSNQSKFWNNFAPDLKDAEEARTRHEASGDAGDVSLFGFDTESDGNNQHKSVDAGNCGSQPQECPGGIDAFGNYAFSNCPTPGSVVTGRCQTPGYSQPGSAPSIPCTDTGQRAVFSHMGDGQLGLPATANMMAVAMGKQAVLTANLLQDPSRRGPMNKACQQARSQQSSDNQGNCCQNNCGTAFNLITDNLINVANENAALPTTCFAPYKTTSQVIWMVQRMFHCCYLPIAFLLILPGALLTQVKGMVGYQLLGHSDEDCTSPFSGILRSIIAVFLIPATQLIVSYCIDIGNSMTEPVKMTILKEHGLNLLRDWVKEQAFTCDPSKNDNCAKRVLANVAQGKLDNVSSLLTIGDQQSSTTVKAQEMFNTINSVASQGILLMNGFQFVIMCYLFLLGPIAAAFFAWPSGIGRDLFKKSFSTWFDAVVVLALWKFWWCIVLLCMVVRLKTNLIDPNDQFEMYFFTAFMGILLYVPFHPFDFRPGDIVGQVLEKAQQQGGGGGAGSGAGQSSAGSRSGGAKINGGARSASSSSNAASHGATTTNTDNRAVAGSGNDSASASSDSTNQTNVAHPMRNVQATGLSAVVPQGIAPPPGH